MYPAMDYLGMPLYTQPYLLECDIDLVKNALYGILHPNGENADPPLKSIQITEALINYIDGCNNAFLASENIRAFLLLSLLATLIISFIAFATLPVTPLSIALICIVSLILFSVNVFTLFHQMNGYQQEIDWAKLNPRCSEYTKELYSKKFKGNSLSNPLGEISSPTSALCLFPAKKITQNTDNNLSNHTEHRLSSINENSYEAFMESSENNPLISLSR